MLYICVCLALLAWFVDTARSNPAAPGESSHTLLFIYKKQRHAAGCRYYNTLIFISAGHGVVTNANADAHVIFIVKSDVNVNFRALDFGKFRALWQIFVNSCVAE